MTRSRPRRRNPTFPLVAAAGAALIAACLGATAFAGDPPAAWEQIYEEEGVKVSRKDVAGSPLVAFKGDAVVDASALKVLWVIVDNDHRVEWVDRLYKSEVLERIDAHEFYLYQAFQLPILISNRDYVYHGRARRDPETGALRVDMMSEEHAKAPETIGVRAHLIDSAYIITPIDDTHCRVEVEIHTDPKGWVPTWLVNMIQESWPLKTLRGIREQVTKPHVKDYAMPPDLKPDERKPAHGEPEKKEAVVGGG